jgi:hypothetical protein
MESGHMTDASREGALALAFAATLWTGVVLGLNRMALNIIGFGCRSARCIS